MQPDATTAHAIYDTLARYNLAGDRGRIDELVACFRPDGVLEIDGDWRAVGREEIASRLSDVRDRGGEGPILFRHHLTTHRSELESSTDARAWTYFFVVTERGPDHGGRYVDRLRCVDGDWLFRHRRVVVEWRAPETRFPEPSGRDS